MPRPRGKGTELALPGVPLAPPLNMRMIGSGGPTRFEATFDATLHSDVQRLEAKSS